MYTYHHEGWLEWECRINCSRTPFWDFSFGECLFMFLNWFTRATMNTMKGKIENSKVRYFKSSPNFEEMESLKL